MTASDKIRVYEEAKKELARLHEEERIASIAQQARNQAINEAYAVVTFLAKSLETSDNGEMPSSPEVEVEISEERSAMNYPDNGTWQDKIKAVIKHVGKVLKISDIVDLIEEEEKRLDSGYSKTQILGVVSNNSSKMARDGMLGVYKSPKKEKGYYYGNPLWWEGGELKEAYKPEIKTKSLW